MARPDERLSPQIRTSGEGLRNRMANESGGIRPLLIIILTKMGHSSINSLSFPPSLPLGGIVYVVFSLELWLRGFWISTLWILDFYFVDFGFLFYSFLSDASAHRMARRDLQRDFRSFIIITTVVYREVGRIHQ
jgi:hypothetical protein